jgi:hypothetical protein
MNPENKAKELIEKFKDYAYVDWHGGDDEMTQDQAAKECAIICVDEILSLNCESFDIEPNPHHYYSRKYWQEVKSKILSI